jgi:hypothetical protein
MISDNSRKICSRCVMPESPPDITIDAEGICSLCRTWDKMKNFEEEQKPLESDFLKIINKYKGKFKYDCMVMCSGGKDSTSALYYMVKRFRLNPLAFTFDHGFETEEAMENIRKAVEILDVDFLLFRSGHMKEMFSRILKTNSKAVICHPCSIWYMDLAFDVAARYEIPIIVAGWTKGQSTRQDVMSKCGCSIHAPEFRQMAVHTKDFLDTQLKDMPRYKNFPASMEDVISRAKKRHKSIVVSPHWFLPFGPEVYVETIKNELGWKAPVLSYPKGSTNCALNFISVHNSMKHYGYTHYHVELSKLIRQGVITRDEALSQLEMNFSKDLLNGIAKDLDYTFD